MSLIEDYSRILTQLESIRDSLVLILVNLPAPSLNTPEIEPLRRKIHEIATQTSVSLSQIADKSV